MIVKFEEMTDKSWTSCFN